MSGVQGAKDNAVFGILMMMGAVFLWVIHDVISKWLTETYSVFQVLLVRGVAGFVPVLLILYGEKSFKQLSGAPRWLLLGRGLLGVTSFCLFLAALPLMPLADAFAIVMSAPLVITALSVIVLRERVGPRRWVAVGIGFAAMLFMMRPGGAFHPLGATYLVASVLLYAFAMLATRVLGRTESAAVMTFYSCCIFLAVGCLIGPFVWIPPTTVDFMAMVTAGLIAGVALYCMTQAFRVAPPAVVAPFEYTSLVWAMLFGYLVWGDIPTVSVVTGAVIIVTSGLYVLHRERVRGV